MAETVLRGWKKRDTVENRAQACGPHPPFSVISVFLHMWEVGISAPVRSCVHRCLLCLFPPEVKDGLEVWGMLPGNPTPAPEDFSQAALPWPWVRG